MGRRIVVSEAYKAVKVTDKVYWVGAIDWAIRDFHGYLTSKGTTYNAFLILAEKITLIDTVKAPFKQEMLSRIASVVAPDKIDYIVSNHSEPDHTGCLVETVRIVKPDKVFASTMGKKAIHAHYGLGDIITPVKDGEKLSLGDMDLMFIETRMLHWPDSMFTYLSEERLLFSQDGFGMHFASSERFSDELDAGVLDSEAAKYYANILMPFSKLIPKLIDKLTGLHLDIRIVAPDHGPLYRRQEDISHIIDNYSLWAAQKPERKAVVLFDTMWQSTHKMALAIGEGLAGEGVSVRLHCLKSSHRSDIATDILTAGALLVGSPTLNNNLFPTIADLLTYIKGLKPLNLVGAAFGSFGWSGEAVGQVNEILEAMNVALVSNGLKIQYIPDEQALEQCRLLGVDVARKL